MPSIKSRVRRLAQNYGVELSPFPFVDPLWRLTQMLQRGRVDLVLDVGANVGEYGLALRRHGYEGEIVSFEPVAEVRRQLVERTDADRKWSAQSCALGPENKEVTIHVAGNSAASSSVLPMLERHERAAPSSTYIRDEVVQQRRLDDVVTDLAGVRDRRVFLKLDVQGYEKFVLQGAPDLLASVQLVGLQLEMSFVPLYEGGMLVQEAIEFGASLGMTLVGLNPGFTDAGGQVLQADAVFFRGDEIVRG